MVLSIALIAGLMLSGVHANYLSNPGFEAKNFYQIKSVNGAFDPTIPLNVWGKTSYVNQVRGGYNGNYSLEISQSKNNSKANRGFEQVVDLISANCNSTNSSNRTLNAIFSIFRTGLSKNDNYPFQIGLVYLDANRIPLFFYTQPLHAVGSNNWLYGSVYGKAPAETRYAEVVIANTTSSTGLERGKFDTADLTTYCT